jgi:hypothetical protein
MIPSYQASLILGNFHLTDTKTGPSLANAKKANVCAINGGGAGGSRNLHLDGRLPLRRKTNRHSHQLTKLSKVSNCYMVFIVKAATKKSSSARKKEEKPTKEKSLAKWKVTHRSQQKNY